MRNRRNLTPFEELAFYFSLFDLSISSMIRAAFFAVSLLFSSREMLVFKLSISVSSCLFLSFS